MGIFGFLPSLKTLESVFDTSPTVDQKEKEKEKEKQLADAIDSLSLALDGPPSAAAVNTNSNNYSDSTSASHQEFPAKRGSTVSSKLLPHSLSHSHSQQHTPQLHINTTDSSSHLPDADQEFSADSTQQRAGDPLSNVIFRRAINDPSPSHAHHHSFLHQSPLDQSNSNYNNNYDRSDIGSPSTPTTPGAGLGLPKSREPFSRPGSENGSGSGPGASGSGSGIANGIASASGSGSGSTKGPGNMSVDSSAGAGDNLGTGLVGRPPHLLADNPVPLSDFEQQTIDFPPIKRAPSKPGFFFRLKKSDGRPTIEDEQDADLSADRRDEGWKADVVGYVPNLPSAPKYIHVRAHKKQQREFNRVFLAQELKPPELEAPLDNMASAKKRYGVWSAKFSKDGRYLAVAGEDAVVRIWQVISWPQDRNMSDDDGDTASNSGNNNSNNGNGNSNSNGDGPMSSSSQASNLGSNSGSTANFGSKAKGDYAPVFKPVPVREFFGHSADVLDLSWSKNNFLLSSSMDKTVRLWHVDRSACLGSFLHSDFVTCIQFHPNDDRFFLSGSLDCKLRLWSIPDRQTAFEAKVPDLITAMAFSPNGTVAIAGCFGGQCFFYETDGLKYQTQMHVRSSRGKNANGSKVTGIEVFQLPPEARFVRGQTFDNDVKLLISTNDSRIRVYNFFDRTLEFKFKGNENEQSQIRASFSDNGMYIISGSEDDRTYIWNLKESPREKAKKKKERQEYEYFHSNKSMVTVALFAPTLTRRILAASGDPVFQICDPPPVKLTPYGPEFEYFDNHYLTAGQLQRMTSSERLAKQNFPPLKPESKRSQHNDGNIIVTADRDGVIKIFRQDCAFEARKLLSDTASIMQRKRMSGIGLSPTHSWRESFSIHRSRSAKAPSVRTGSPRPLPHSNSGGSNNNNNNNNNNNKNEDMSRRPVHYMQGASNSSLGVGVGVGSAASERERGRSRAGSLSHPHERYNERHQPSSSSLSRLPRSVSDNKIDDPMVSCNNCGGTSFLAKKVNNSMQLVCCNCMTPAIQQD